MANPWVSVRGSKICSSPPLHRGRLEAFCCTLPGRPAYGNCWHYLWCIAQQQWSWRCGRALEFATTGAGGGGGLHVGSERCKGGGGGLLAPPIGRTEGQPTCQKEYAAITFQKEEAASQAQLLPIVHEYGQG